MGDVGIATPGGRVEAPCLARLRGLGVVPDLGAPNAAWSVTHLGSGYSVISGLSLRKAKKVLRLATADFDWTPDKDELDLGAARAVAERVRNAVIAKTA